ncbi:cobalt-precorrin-5B (C(1))-methyltransferase CbiD [uncultured Parolsenella sp.]|uniref:cobalt-precorrin-5B (C(1))-methyltransferase CbiD n=1 Tax=uncultured Parolsenella sp. TaxID=2083008 RepID=UPI0025E30643|nr:cobalt-precorrin-5B (C(1))-methyltransferase CbiD [uncultured Parolsenella sp.]
MRPSDEPGSVAGAPRPLGPAPSAADDALAETHAAGTSQADAAGSHYIFNGTKRLRCGYTTGSCAAMAAQAATRGLLSGSVPARVGLVTPSGLRVDADVLDADVAEGGSAARAAIRKDGGDDADSTDGMLVYARVGRAARAEGEPRVRIEGGRGIGIVRKPGLDQPVGAAAINSTPRRMIAEEVVRACDELGYDGGIDVVIYAPTGAEVGAKTFNPHMGVEGGISILGTSGIVRPMSERALVASIELEIRQKAAEGARDLVLVPGNYGADHVRELAELDGLAEVSFSNFLGEALDAAANHGFQRVLVVGHSGKLAKVAGGVMNTHSRVADCRCEIVCAHAAIAGASTACCRAIMSAATTDACMGILADEGLLEAVCRSLMDAIGEHIDHRAAGAFETGAIMFSKRYGEFGRTRGCNELIAAMRASAGLPPVGPTRPASPAAAAQ